MAEIFQMTSSNAFSWMNFDKNFTEVCSIGSNEQYSNTGSDNGSVLTRQQAIIWSRESEVSDVYIRHLASMS